MKKLSYALMIVLSGYLIQGCNSAPKDAKDAADSLNKTKDTTSNAAATGGIAVTNDDSKFATAAANAGMAEVALGKLASEKAVSPQVRDYAKMMIADHGKANTELMAIAKTKNITLPTTVDEEHQKKMNDLGKMTGKDFDKAYVDAMIDGHKNTLTLMQDETKDGKDADLKAFAAKTVPVVQTHLDAVNKIHDSMK